MSQTASIDGAQFARSGSVLTGRLLPSAFPRLESLGCLVIEGIDFRVEGHLGRQGQLLLRLTAGGSLRMTCQRCLDPLVVPLRTSAELELAGSLSEIEDAEDDVDRVLASGSMAVAPLVEDEIILALPMVPRHAECAEGTHPEELGRRSPFAALARLKDRE